MNQAIIKKTDQSVTSLSRSDQETKEQMTGIKEDFPGTGNLKPTGNIALKSLLGKLTDLTKQLSNFTSTRADAMAEDTKRFFGKSKEFVKITNSMKSFDQSQSLKSKKEALAQLKLNAEHYNHVAIKPEKKGKIDNITKKKVAYSTQIREEASQALQNIQEFETELANLNQKPADEITADDMKFLLKASSNNIDPELKAQASATFESLAGKLEQSGCTDVFQELFPQNPGRSRLSVPVASQMVTSASTNLSNNDKAKAKQTVRDIKHQLVDSSKDKSLSQKSETYTQVMREFKKDSNASKLDLGVLAQLKEKAEKYLEKRTTAGESLFETKFAQRNLLHSLAIKIPSKAPRGETITNQDNKEFLIGTKAYELGSQINEGAFGKVVSSNESKVNLNELSQESTDIRNDLATTLKTIKRSSKLAIKTMSLNSLVEKETRELIGGKTEEEKNKIIESKYEEMKSEINNEAELMIGINHENIIGIKEVITNEKTQTFHFVMDKMKTDARKLPRRLSSPRGKMRLATDFTKGLQHLHQNNLVHRDLKPANLFISSNNTGVLGDLGLTAKKDSIQDPSGTPVCAAPELLLASGEKQPATTATDIFSLGMCFMDMFVGSTPNSGKNVKIFNILYNYSNFAQSDEAAQSMTDSFDEFLSAKNTPLEIKSLLLDMTKFKPEERISINEVSERLAKITELMQPKTNTATQDISTT